MNILNNILDIFLELELYEHSEKAKENKKHFDRFIKSHGKPIEEKLIENNEK